MSDNSRDRKKFDRKWQSARASACWALLGVNTHHLQAPLRGGGEEELERPVTQLLEIHVVPPYVTTSGRGGEKTFCFEAGFESPANRPIVP